VLLLHELHAQLWRHLLKLPRLRQHLLLHVLHLHLLLLLGW
jgi:hypothetical protein